jgi:hypothetical protein
MRFNRNLLATLAAGLLVVATAASAQTTPNNAQTDPKTTTKQHNDTSADPNSPPVVEKQPAQSLSHADPNSNLPDGVGRYR